MRLTSALFGFGLRLPDPLFGFGLRLTGPLFGFGLRVGPRLLLGPNFGHGTGEGSLLHADLALHGLLGRRHLGEPSRLLAGFLLVTGLVRRLRLGLLGLTSLLGLLPTGSLGRLDPGQPGTLPGLAVLFLLGLLQDAGALSRRRFGLVRFVLGLALLLAGPPVRLLLGGTLLVSFRLVNLTGPLARLAMRVARLEFGSFGLFLLGCSSLLVGFHLRSPRLLYFFLFVAGAPLGVRLGAGGPFGFLRFDAGTLLGLSPFASNLRSCLVIAAGLLFASGLLLLIPPRLLIGSSPRPVGSLGLGARRAGPGIGCADLS